MTEEALIARAKKGDEDAFAQLVEAHQNQVYGLTLRLTGSPEDALDLSQETFFNAWRGLPNFQGDCRFSTWLYRLATNVTFDFLRKEKRRREMTAPSLSGVEDSPERDIPDNSSSPQQRVEQKELRQALDAAIAQLSEEHRAVLVLREVSGLSYQEIADLLHLSEGTVKSRIARARVNLGKILSQAGNFFDIPASNLTK